jgi:hypothetical protein
MGVSECSMNKVFYSIFTYGFMRRAPQPANLLVHLLTNKQIMKEMCCAIFLYFHGLKEIAFSYGNFVLNFLLIYFFLKCKPPRKP